MKLILSTSNIMGSGPSVVRRPLVSKSNAELTAALRSNFDSHREQAVASSAPDSTFRSWSAQEGDKLYAPTLDTSGLAEERSAYDITVKLFYLPHVPPSKRCQHAKEAIDLVLRELRVSSIDLLIVSFPGIAFDAEDESEEDEHSDAASLSGLSDPTGGVIEDTNSIVQTWNTLETLHDAGTIARLGLSEFGSHRLARLLQSVRVRPSVDQINVRDCCVVPKPLIIFAKQEGIELLTHNDCTDILPPGTLRELLGPEKGIGILAPSGCCNNSSDGLRGDVIPQWVVKYTAVVKDRGVVENKGYFAAAELQDPRALVSLLSC
ncbi:hypothetical protein EJ06DRAFT_544421 [Trichodelitschia bisporula]|uniref:GCS light chain n=1 Tax=Trichodelitschia bisporula TaxID=703511 RepID=A0A6G1HP53_9PEZI|nr:hypothetical protein EJ06DRAFT_544421 [Trichodelitschia bisporula]